MVRLKFIKINGSSLLPRSKNSFLFATSFEKLQHISDYMARSKNELNSSLHSQKKV